MKKVAMLFVFIFASIVGNVVAAKNDAINVNDVVNAFQSNGLNISNVRKHDVHDIPGLRNHICSKEVSVYEFESKNIAMKYTLANGYKMKNAVTVDNIAIYVWVEDPEKYLKVFDDLKK